MLALYENIKKRRMQLNMTQKELAEAVGYSDKSMISKVERGDVDLSQAKLFEFAEALHTTPSALMGSTELKSNNYLLYSVMEVHAGYNGIELEPTEEKESIPLDWIKGDSPDSFIVYKVKGQSMYPMMEEGDRLLVHRQSSVNSGEIAVIVSAEMSSVKRVIYNPDLPTYIRLEAINPTFPPMVIEGEAELNQTFVIGKVVRQIRTF